MRIRLHQRAFREQFSRLGYGGQSQPERYREAESGERWITIGEGKGDGGGTHVKVDGSGRITGGPAALEGKSLDGLGKGQQDDARGHGEALKAKGSHEANGWKASIEKRPDFLGWGVQLHSPTGATTFHAPEAKAGGGGGTSWQDAAEHGGKLLAEKAQATAAPPASLSLPQPGHAYVQALPDGRWVGSAVLHRDELSVDPARFQYKVVGIDSSTGVTSEYADAKTYQPDLAGALLAWHDPADGKNYVINGHHRFEIAQRSPTHDRWGGEMLVRFIDAQDEKEARARGAIANIADKKGTATDAAKFFRETNTTVADLENEGVSISGPIARDALALKSLAEPIFRRVAAQELREDVAIPIGEHLAGDDRKQTEVLRSVDSYESRTGNQLSRGQVERMAARKAHAPVISERVKTLWGDEEEESDVDAEIGILSDWTARQLRSRKNAFAAGASKKKGTVLSEIDGNVLDQERNRTAAQRADEAVADFEREQKYTGELNDKLAEAAIALRQAGESKDGQERVKADFLRWTQDYLARMAQPGAGAGDGAGAREAATRGGGGEVAPEAYRRADAYRRVSYARQFAEHYARNFDATQQGEGEIVVEQAAKRSQIEANYRPAAGYPNCGCCAHFRAGRCEIVAGVIRAEDVCDCWTARQVGRQDDPEAYRRPGETERYAGRWEESKHPRAEDGRFGTKAGQHAGDAPGKPATPLASGPGPDAPKPAAGGANATEPADSVDEVRHQPKTAPPPGGYAPDPGQAQPGELLPASRVGVGPHEVPPPPSKIHQLPNLNPDERRVETSIRERFEANPDGEADRYIQAMESGVFGPNKTNVFGTDEAKLIMPELAGHPDPAERKKAQALYNTAAHQTANATTKRAFMRYLDKVAKLPPERRNVLVTAGGCAAGKGFAIGKVPHVLESQKLAGAVWDSAGEQNSNELPWIADECAKRGIGVHAVYVHANAEEVWDRALSRAAGEGRMVDARVFSDSHTHGARNFQKFAQSYGANPNVSISYIDNGRPAKDGIDPKTGQPAKIPDIQPMNGIPPEALQRDPDQLYHSILQRTERTDAPAHVKQAALAGTRIWPE